MRRKKKVWLSGFVEGVAATAILGGLICYVQYGTLPLVGGSLTTGSSGKKLVQIEKIVENNYLEEYDEQTLEDSMYAGLLSGLDDPYSGYYSEELYTKLKESSEGKYKGIGCVLQQDADTGEIMISQCYAGSPGEVAGLEPGDIIRQIGDQAVAGMSVSELADSIKSDETGTVVLRVEREGEEDLLEITVTLDVVEIPAIYSRKLENSMGYIQIVEFTDLTSGQFETAYQELLEQDIQGLMIDLRNNPGGLLTAVCDTLEQILPEGMIVYTEDKNGNRVEHTCKGETPIEIPLVVLTNEESASAAEIFAGAVKDHEVGTLVGTTTFGKGIVQKIYPLSDGSAVKITVSKYYTPNGVNIHGTGIEPDVTEEWEQEDALLTPSQYNELPQEEWIEQDNQFAKGLEILSDLMEEKE